MLYSKKQVIFKILTGTSVLIMNKYSSHLKESGTSLHKMHTPLWKFAVLACWTHTASGNVKGRSASLMLFFSVYHHKAHRTTILLKTIFFKHESNSNLQEKLKMQFTDHDKPYRAVFTQSWNITIHCSIWVALWFIMVMLLVWNYIHLDTQLSVTDRQRGRESICIFPFTHFLLIFFSYCVCYILKSTW